MATTDDHPAVAPHRVRREVMRMRWLNLTLLHWRFDPDRVQAALPADLRVDTFDGAAWIGLVPFQMEVRLAGGIPIPRQGRFPETNVRTYVRGPDGTPGVWFASLEAGRLAATVVARVTYGLPYFWAAMTAHGDGDTWRYRSRRRWPGEARPASRVTVDVGSPLAEQSARDRFLTARWGLYSTFLGHTLYAPVWHEPWKLRHATVRELDDELVAAAGFAPPDEEPLLHWAPGVDVRIGRPRRVRPDRAGGAGR